MESKRNALLDDKLLQIKILDKTKNGSCGKRITRRLGIEPTPELAVHRFNHSVTLSGLRHKHNEINVNRVVNIMIIG